MSDFFDRLSAKGSVDEPSELGTTEEPTDSLPKDGDEPTIRYTPVAIRATLQELLRAGTLDLQTKPRLFQTAVSESKKIAEILEPLDLRLHLDEIRGLAFVGVADWVREESSEDGWTHPLLRRQRLTLEQSLLVAILRRFFVSHEQEVGIGAGNARVALEDVAVQLEMFLPDSGSDQRNEQRLRTLLEQLRAHGLVSEIDREDAVIIRPLIAHLANPHSLSALLEVFRTLNMGRESGDTPSEEAAR
jgi:hypothetical protein